MIIHLQLGKCGDLLNLLPLMYRDSLKGDKPKLCVAKEFASVLEGCSYVEPIIYEGSAHEIEKAVEFVQNRYPDSTIHCTQINGPLEQVKKHVYKGDRPARTTSFPKEMWDILGRLDEWDELHPLVFDRRDKSREEKLLLDNLKGGKPMLLLAINGTTSPFPYTHLLRKLVNLEFGHQYNIVDVPQCERIYDLLGLYEHADLLIAADSAPLHLAWACRKLPVIALTQDKPSLWHGSPWRPNHYWYCRYSDWPKRSMDMLQAIHSIKSYNPSEAFITVCSDYGFESDCHRVGNHIRVTDGMCGKDSVSVLKDSKRHPYLKDVIRMGMQRAPSDNAWILITRRDVSIKETAITTNPPWYSYRMTERPEGLEFRPVGDLFCATKSWWKSRLNEIPDLLLSNDYYWSQCLWAIFQQSGAKDLTGICSRPLPQDQKVWNGTMTISEKHNAALAAKYVSTSKLRSRYPRVSEQIETIPLDASLLPKFSYNPSIFKDEISGKYSMTYRYHPDKGRATRIGICEVVNSKCVNPLDIPIEADSKEDARLFNLHRKRWMSWVEATGLGLSLEHSRAVLKYAQLKPIPQYLQKEKNAVFEIGAINHIQAGGNEGRSIQKNWCFFESDENLFCIHKSILDQTIWQIRGHKVVAEWNNPPLRWPYGNIRGGSVVPWNDKLLRVFHSALDNEPSLVRRRYYIGACLMENKPPFKTVRVSTKPIVYGSEIDQLKGAERQACHHWKANVAIPYGAIIEKDSLIVSVGVNDSQCCVLRLKEKDLNL